jgi:group I intron endonuclease
MIQRPQPLSGVYTIRNRVTGATYVGSSSNIEKRVKTHLQALRLGKHKNVLLQTDWTAYGAESFTVGVVAVIPIEDPIDSRYLRESVEQDWMRVLKRRGYLLYSPSQDHFYGSSRRATAIAFWQSQKEIAVAA